MSSPKFSRKFSLTAFALLLLAGVFGLLKIRNKSLAVEAIDCLKHGHCDAMPLYTGDRELNSDQKRKVLNAAFQGFDRSKVVSVEFFQSKNNELDRQLIVFYMKGQEEVGAVVGVKDINGDLVLPWFLWCRTIVNVQVCAENPKIRLVSEGVPFAEPKLMNVLDAAESASIDRGEDFDNSNVTLDVLRQNIVSRMRFLENSNTELMFQRRQSGIK